MTPTPITIAFGNGIGPEIMEATIAIMQAAGAAVAPEIIQIGESVYRQGIKSGIEDSAWESLRRTRVFLKAPITTPQGGGFKSLNVTIRKALGLYANVRPCVAYSPFVKTLHPGMDVVIVRENEEDLYAGIEYRLSEEVYQSLKLISVPGCEKIVRYAFEYARQNNRKRVTCFSKDNIMKLTDGLFHKTFDRIAKEYPDIQSDHWIVDIGAALLAHSPERFDVLVMANLYGDILSDVAAQIAGSIGLAGTANIGDGFAMFEAIHGSAPDIAGLNIANPSGLLLAAVMMLVHIGQAEVATRIHNAWLKTLESGFHTKDVFNPQSGKELLGTREFGMRVVEYLGQEPSTLRPVKYSNSAPHTSHFQYRPTEHPEARTLLGFDVYLIRNERNPGKLARALQMLAGQKLELSLISNRGVKVWPNGQPETYCTDSFICRFFKRENVELCAVDITDFLQRLNEESFEYSTVEVLRDFGGHPGFSAGQGE